MLSTWREGATRSTLVDFVARVTEEGGRDYVPPAGRVAVFDNDGTLWCEQPIQVQIFFLIDRVKQLAAADSSLATLHALGKKATIYRPQVELLEYLRANGFKTYIVSGGGRSWHSATATGTSR